MKELIKYIADILNIKTDSDLVIVDIKTELESIVDIADYRTFLRTNLNHIDTEYLTGFQKFIKLTAIYKRRYAEAINQERLGESYKYALELSEKVRAVSLYVMENTSLDYKNFTHEGKSIFSNFDQKELNKIGGLKKAVLLQRSTSGIDPLFERLAEQIKTVVINQALGHNKQIRTHHSVAGLIGQTAKAVRV